MKAFRLAGYNAAPSIEDIVTPSPGADEVLIRVEAAALNPLDVKLQRGYMEQVFPLQFPYTMGTDLSGEIVGLGPAVAGWSVGDRVIVRTQPTVGGAFAEFAVARSADLAKAPTSLPLVDAAGIGTAAGTAWQALFESVNLKQSQSVLIHAGAGGVGSFAIQFAHKAGARVITTASGDGVAIARRLGAAEVIDYRSADFSRTLSGIDIVLDTIGGDTQERSCRVLRAGGQLLATASPPDASLGELYGVDVGFVFHSTDGERLQRVVTAIDEGGFEVLIDRRFLLGDFAEAFDRQASGRARGKLIVIIA